MIVPSAMPLAMVEPFVGFDSSTVSVSFSSNVASAVVSTVKVCESTPGL